MLLSSIRLHLRLRKPSFQHVLSNDKPLNGTLKKFLQLQMNLNRFLRIMTLEV